MTTNQPRRRPLRPPPEPERPPPLDVAQLVELDPRPLKHGASQTVRFRKRGTVYYLCTFHPGLMRGTIVVR